MPQVPAIQVTRIRRPGTYDSLYKTFSFAKKSQLNSCQSRSSKQNSEELGVNSRSIVLLNMEGVRSKRRNTVDGHAIKPYAMPSKVTPFHESK